jgi:hypothetical protein
MTALEITLLAMLPLAMAYGIWVGYHVGWNRGYVDHFVEDVKRMSR